jgi:hypothetical protein
VLARQLPAVVLLVVLAVLARRTATADARVPRPLVDAVLVIGVIGIVVPVWFWALFLLAPLALSAVVLDARLPLAFGVTILAWLVMIPYWLLKLGSGMADPMDAVIFVAGLAPLAMGWLIGRRRVRI